MKGNRNNRRSISVRNPQPNAPITGSKQLDDPAFPGTTIDTYVSDCATYWPDEEVTVEGVRMAKLTLGETIVHRQLTLSNRERNWMDALGGAIIIGDLVSYYPTLDDVDDAWETLLATHGLKPEDYVAAA